MITYGELGMIDGKESWPISRHFSERSVEI
jgi:hypothetical protein